MVRFKVAYDLWGSVTANDSLREMRNVEIPYGKLDKKAREEILKVLKVTHSRVAKITLVAVRLGDKIWREGEPSSVKPDSNEKLPAFVKGK